MRAALPSRALRLAASFQSLGYAASRFHHAATVERAP